MVSTIRKYFEFGGKSSKKLTRGMAWSIANSFFESVQIWALAIVLADVANGAVGAHTALSSLAVMLLSIGGSFVTAHFKSENFCDGNYSMCAEKRSAIGDRMRYLPMGYFNSSSLGEMASTMTNTLDDVQNIGGLVYSSVISGMVLSCIMALMFWAMDWRCGLLALSAIALILLINALMQSASRALSSRRVKAQRSLVGAVLEYVQGMGVVRAFCLLDRVEGRLGRAIGECEAVNIAAELRLMLFAALETLVCKSASVLMCLLSIGLWLAGDMPTATCLVMVVASFMVFAKLELAGLFSSVLRQIDLSMDKVNELIAEPVMEGGSYKADGGQMGVELRHVSFSYENRRVIDGLSLSIPKGSSCAIVGPSGSGKTTIARLMARFWDVSEGQVLVGGKDVREWDVDSLLASFSIVFQGVYLFDDTIENNIRFGCPEATREQVMEAARRACCNDFIERLDKGYETRIGEGGATLSGGERQRISIARAILKDAPIVVLDEATANVDPENERELQMAVEELKRGKTVIMIAHRLKTVRDADQIAVIDAGRLAQCGSHEELMAQPGIYRKFVDMREKTIGWRLATQG